MKSRYVKNILSKSNIILSLVTTVFIINSCRKSNSSDNRPKKGTEIVALAKIWYAQKQNSVNATSKINMIGSRPLAEPVWDEYTINQTNSDERQLIVKTQGPESANSKYGIISSIVFTFKDGQILAGNRVDVIGDPDYLKTQGLQLSSRYKDAELPGLGNGAFIVYDVNQNLQESHTLINGKINKSISTTLVKFGDLPTAPAIQQPSSQTSQAVAPISSQCLDWYLITRDATTGVILSEVYLYTTCTNTASGNGGSGGTSGTFGLNNSNAQITDTNFDAFLSYVESQGYSYSDPVNESITYNGISYPGQLTEIFDANGNLVCSYFSPDANSNLFQVGLEYNVGNGRTASFGSPEFPSYLNSGRPVTYAHPPTVTAGSASGTNTAVDAESNLNESDNDPDIVWWNDNTTTYPQQNLPTWANMYANYPKNSSGGDLPGPQVYSLVGGAVLDAYNSDPNSYQNACALRVSRALNYSGINIPVISGQTYKGSDNKNYFLSSAKLYNFMKKTFGVGSIVLSQSDGGPGGTSFNSHLSGKKGIYIMQAAYPGLFGALGHCTLYTGSDCIGGHNYFNAKGGVEKVTLWILN